MQPGAGLSLVIGLAISMAPIAATLGPLAFVLQAAETHLVDLPNDAHRGGFTFNTAIGPPRSSEPLRDLVPLTSIPLLDLGTLPPADQSVAQAVNEAGQVVGGSTADAPWTHGFLWDNGTMTDLGSLGGKHDYSWAYDINDTGSIVGKSYYTDNVGDSGMLAFLWENGTMRDLGVGFYSEAFAIDNAGHVVGSANRNDGGLWRAFLWQEGVTTDLGTLGGQYSAAYDVNPAGQVIGESEVASHAVHAFLWENGTMTDLGTLGGTSSHATAINEAGQVVGWSANASGANHAFLWENGTMTDLGTLGGNSSAASGINDASLIVGTSQTSNSSHGFLWVNGLMTDLGTLGGSSTAAYGINDADQVVGESQVSTGLYHAFLWPPPLTPYHNVGVTGDGDPQDVIVGRPVTIHVTAHNEGNRNETFNVTTYAGSILIGTRTVTDLPAFKAESWSYTWDTTNATPDWRGYALRFEASPVANETYLQDNNYTGPTVMVRYAAQVTATPSATDVGLPISFTCSSVDLPPTDLLDFGWDFGDGVVRAGANLSHVYDSPGTFTADCLVINHDGATAEGQLIVEIHAAPAVTAIVDRPEANPGMELAFNATTTGGSGGFTFDWAFGDGSSGQGAPVSHAYAAVGEYMATVTARDSAGGTALSTVSVNISGPPVPLHALAVVDPSAAAVGARMSFSGAANGGVPPYTFSWDFGDGSGTEGARVTHTYVRPGVYVAVMTVHDSVGNTASNSMRVTISYVVVIASAGRATSSPGKSITFSARAAGGTGSFEYLWSFGDGSSALGATVAHAYAYSGQYMATARVTDSLGAIASTYVVVTISWPSAIASSSTTSSLPQETITFTARGSGGAGDPFIFTWDFGDGSEASGATVTHAYSSPGSYIVGVTVTDASGSTRAQILPTIRVKATPPLPVSPFPGFSSLAIGTSVAISGGIVVGLFLLRRRRRRP